MAENDIETPKLEDKNNAIREEIQFQYFWYLFVFFTIYLSSFIVPALMFMAYVFSFFLPNFLEISYFLALFTEMRPLLALISMPLVIIGCYLIRLFLIGLVTRLFWSYTEKKSPSKEGIIPRNFPSKTLNYYHIRSFLINYGKNAFTKGAFPWLTNWLYNFVGSSVFGKGSTMEESICNDKFGIVGKNCYFGVGSTLATHLVDGTFGNINYFHVKIGDNVTAAGKNLVSAGSEVNDNSFLLPLASAGKHSVLKGNNYYWGLPLRKIFRKKVMEYLDLTPKELEMNENIEGYTDKKLLAKLKSEKSLKPGVETNQDQQEKSIAIEENIDINSLTEGDLALDFTTSSAISRVNIKFLAVYIPIFWLSGMLDTIIFYTFVSLVGNRFLIVFFLPTMIFIMWFIFIVGCFFFSKLFLILINLIHKPKEGVFSAEIGDTDFEFWSLRTEIKKIVLWLLRNWPLPWADILAFKFFGVKMTLSCSLYDSWCDSEFITFGRRVLVGQGATISSSMVFGKYLIIKNVICSDYSLIGAHSTIAPGTIIGQDTFVSALSTTVYSQILEPGWIYIGIPCIKLKPNKYAESQREILMKRDVDEEKKFEIEHEVNIDEDKKDLL
jgi:acetyltransferase-like isoleucine patch superfamily enzyme